MAKNDTYSGVDTRLGAAFSNARGQSAANTAIPEGATTVRNPDSFEWGTQPGYSDLGAIGSFYNDYKDQDLADNARFDLATALASRDMELGKSKGSRTQQNYRDLAEQYFRDLGGNVSRFDVDYALGIDRSPFQKGLDTIGGYYDSAMNAAGGALDTAFDATVGNIAGALGGDEVGEKVKNWKSGEDLAWIPSAAIDIGTWLLPGVNNLKIAGLLGKGLLDNRQAIEQAATGRDQNTGESLSGSQRAVNAAAGLFGTALTALPGAGVLKGAERKAAREIADKGDEALIKAEAQAGKMETSIKDAEKEARKYAKNAGVKLKNGKNQLSYDEIKEKVGQLDPNTLDDEQKIALENFKKIDEELTPKFKASLDEAKEGKSGAQAAIDRANQSLGTIEDKLLPTRYGEAGVSFKEVMDSLRPKFSGNNLLLGDLTPNALYRRSKAKTADIAANNARKRQAKNLGDEIENLKKSNGAADDLAQKQADLADLEKEIEQASKTGGLFGGSLKNIKEGYESAVDSPHPVRDVIAGNGLMFGNSALQASAALGSDSEGFGTDLASMVAEDPASFLSIVGLGLVPGFHNSRLRRNGFSPYTKYGLEADALAKMIRDKNVGMRNMTEDDLMLLDLVLQGRSPEEAAQIFSEAQKAESQGSGEKEEEGEKDGSK